MAGLSLETRPTDGPNPLTLKKLVDLVELALDSKSNRVLSRKKLEGAPVYPLPIELKEASVAIGLQESHLILGQARTIVGWQGRLAA